MKATKYEFTIRVEVLHPDSVASLLGEASIAIQSETPEGRRRHDDGDEVSWSVVKTDVVI